MGTYTLNYPTEAYLGKFTNKKALEYKAILPKFIDENRK